MSDLLTGIVLEAPTIGGKASPLLRTHIMCFCHALQVYTFQLYHTYRHGVTFLRIFLRRFTDRSNVIFPLQCTIVQAIMFGLVIPNKNTNKGRASANLKPVTQSKYFYSFRIIRVQDQNAFQGFWLISTTRSNCF